MAGSMSSTVDPKPSMLRGPRGKYPEGMGTLTVLVTLIWIGALVDVILSPADRIKRLPKVAWVLVVAFLSLIGALLWFGLGRDWSGVVRPPRMPDRLRPQALGPQQGGEFRATPLGDPRSTEQQLEDLDREIAFYKRKAELEAKRPRLAIEAAPGDRAVDHEGAEERTEHDSTTHEDPAVTDSEVADSDISEDEAGTDQFRRRD